MPILRNKIRVLLALSVPLLFTGCASLPTGPSVMALPGTGQSFEKFRYDDAACKQFATAQIGGTSANEESKQSFTRNAVVGTMIGTAIGAAAGGRNGVGVGAAGGLAMGSMIGAGESQGSMHETQRRYDNAYVQCMYASGHKVPVPADYTLRQQPAAPRVTAPAPATIPPPPPGMPPPPPPDLKR